MSLIKINPEITFSSVEDTLRFLYNSLWNKKMFDCFLDKYGNEYSPSVFNEEKGFKHDNTTHEIRTYNYYIDNNTKQIKHKFGDLDNSVNSRLVNRKIIDFPVDMEHQGYRKLRINPVNAVKDIDIEVGGQLIGTYLFKYTNSQPYFDIMENNNVLPNLKYHDSYLIIVPNPDYVGEFEISYEIVKVLSDLTVDITKQLFEVYFISNYKFFSGHYRKNSDNQVLEYVIPIQSTHYLPCIRYNIFLNKSDNIDNICLKSRFITLDDYDTINYKKYDDKSKQEELERLWSFKKVSNNDASYQHYIFECDKDLAIHSIKLKRLDDLYICIRFSQGSNNDEQTPILITENKDLARYASGMLGLAFYS